MPAVRGEQQYEYERPLFVDDILTGNMTLGDVYLREGRSGRTMTFAVLRPDFSDESG